MSATSAEFSVEVLASPDCIRLGCFFLLDSARFEQTKILSHILKS